ncbi:MAG TPA: NF038104 family lipoprotein [Caulobacteraceae bacterium]|nr:NF038104 family lipoprotein [Caulobacteraceae bacterium]
MLKLAIVMGAAALMLQGCLAASVAGATVGAAGTVVGAAAKGTVAVGKAVIPGGGDDSKDR